MEYMLFADGSVKVFDKIETGGEVLMMMNLWGGVAYYWPIDDVNWGYLTADVRAKTISTEEVPDVIKLAAMLE